MSADENAATPSANRPFGLLTLTMIVIGSMVGTGIFTTSGFTLAAVGTPARVLGCWIAGCLIALCGAVTYGHLARCMPESGGEYLYLSRRVHPLVGFLAGWVSLTAGFSGAVAAAALALEDYLQLSEQTAIPHGLTACAAIVFCAVLHSVRIRAGALTQNVTVILQIGSLLALLGLALWNIGSHPWAPLSPPDPPAFTWSSFGVSVLWISFSFAGFNSAVYVASESKQAARDVPRALLIGTLLVAGLYLLLNLVFVRAAPVEELAGRGDIAAVAMEAISSSSSGGWIRGVISLSLLTSVMGMMMAGPRVYSRMADDRVFPVFFAAANGGIRRSVWLQAVIACVLILIHQAAFRIGAIATPLEGLLRYISITLAVSAAACAATVPLQRTAGTPASLGTRVAAAAYVIATAGCVLLPFLPGGGADSADQMRHAAGAVLTFATGVVAWRLMRTGTSNRQQSVSSGDK